MKSVVVLFMFLSAVAGAAEKKSGLPSKESLTTWCYDDKSLPACLSLAKEHEEKGELNDAASVYGFLCDATDYKAGCALRKNLRGESKEPQSQAAPKGGFNCVTAPLYGGGSVTRCD